MLNEQKIGANLMENDNLTRNTAMTRSSSCNSRCSSRNIANVANYKSDEGKMKASLKWIVSRVYGDSCVPDGLRSLFVEDTDGNLQLSPPLIASLVNGSLYGQAASRIFQNASFASTSQHCIGPVFSALSHEGIDVRDPDGNAIMEETLRQSNPINLHAHLHMIDALMTAHLRSLVSIDKIVHAISNYTSVEKREEPLDCVDALLFWINKVCLLIRDDIEHNGLVDVDELPTIPEMEDLYEDLCDGTCICALVSFYRPDELLLREICFNDPMSVNDCRFNLELLSKFCSSCLPWNPFHFETEDILYLHESLQPNINVFLADLFQFFESHSLITPSEPTPALQRRFVPIKPIPDLRTQDIAYAGKGTGGMLKTADNRRGMGANVRDRASSLASQDSLMTNTTLKTKDSLSVNTPRPNSLDPNAPSNVTHFAAFKDANPSSNGSTQQQNQKQQRQLKNAAEVRLQMEELRRQLAQRQQMEMVKQEQRRCEASKDAFFKVMGKSTTNQPNETLQSQLTPIGRPNQPAAVPMSPTDDTYDTSLVAKFQQMQTHFGSQQQLVPTAGSTVSYGQHQQLHTPQQQQRHVSTLSSTGVHTPNTLMHTSTPYMTAVSSFHPMLSPIANCSLNAGNANGSLVGAAATLPMMGGSTFSQPVFGNDVQQRQQPVGMPSVAQQQIATVEQSHYAVPSELHPIRHHPHNQQQQQQHQIPFNVGAGFGGTSFGAAVPSLQSASSAQPMHLHMVNQHQQIPPTFAYQQPMHHHPHQSQAQIHQPFYQHVPQQFPSTQQMSFQQQPNQFQSQHLQQHYIPSPLPPPINSATMFPQPDIISIPPPPFLSQHTQLVGNVVQPNDSSGSTFRLHQANAPLSRLDPQLDLNKDLTNWSQMTYRDGDRPQRKTWAQKQTELDKSNPTLNLASSGNANVEGQRMRACLSGDESVVNSPEKDQQLSLNRTYIKSTTDDSVTLVSPSPAVFTNGSGSATNNRSGGVVLKDVSEPNSEMTPEMQAKRRAILASQLRRKERIMAKSEEKETEELDRLQVKMQRIEQAELRRVEREQRRQKLLEDYKRKKMEQELLMEPGSARTTAASSSTLSLNRGHSQPPPFGRPKSQSNMNLANAGGTLTKRAGRAQSNMGNNNATGDQNGGGSSTARTVAEPSLKLYAKQPSKSNRGLIMNALQYSVFPGHVSNDQRQKAQAAIAQSDAKHFLVLFRDHQCQYRGLYTWDQFSDTAHKIEGLGPKVCRESMMTIMFKYDSGAKAFGQIPTKHLSATIDGFVISDQFWQKPKIPHSGR